MDIDPDDDGRYDYPSAGDLVKDLQRIYGIQSIRELPRSKQEWDALGLEYCDKRNAGKDSTMRYGVSPSGEMRAEFQPCLPHGGFRDVVTKALPSQAYTVPSFWGRVLEKGRLLAAAIWH